MAPLRKRGAALPAASALAVIGCIGLLVHAVVAFTLPVVRRAAADRRGQRALTTNLPSVFSASSRAGAVPRRGVKEDFEGGVDKARVVLFTKASCMKCEMAKETLTTMGIRFATMEIENELGLDAIGPARAYKDYMETKTGSQDLPQVHVKGGKGVAGLDGIFEKQDSGELLEWAREAGAARR
eukprot:CAMPEP_0171092204 /NCGR_PEP_ID=MMETSP0766_2-20121228/35556_1 /TAXON_ID=439317 /ORGANISM="Gambierdiscus australes, Strain CAWD 149" /LENGTH=182 /DNA_ID=CAMNT_0011550411 /DNA_START=34 /DNA_END=582 /DNA_ORIENTATION=+